MKCETSRRDPDEGSTLAIELRVCFRPLRSALRCFGPPDAAQAGFAVALRTSLTTFTEFGGVRQGSNLSKGAAESLEDTLGCEFLLSQLPGQRVVLYQIPGQEELAVCHTNQCSPTVTALRFPKTKRCAVEPSIRFRERYLHCTALLVPAPQVFQALISWSLVLRRAVPSPEGRSRLLPFQVSLDQDHAR